MPGGLRDRSGQLTLRTRLLSLLVVIGLVVLTAPLVVLPLLRWLLGSTLP